MLFFKTTSYFIQYAEVLYMFFPFCDTLILNRWIPKGWFNKINNFYFLIKDILKWNWISFFFSPVSILAVEEHGDDWCRLVPPPWFMLRHQEFYPAVAFAQSVQMSAWWKGRWRVSIIMKIVFTWQTPWKSLRAVDPTLSITGLVVSGTW